ncbi:DUF732 domain-containing protein [uncultured Corynebacterium sp.]|uniref:DUF732 domain-containing protein n=1 Tax=uncultured Corynebacterium sp. TaxID=159447 RepID=UPI0025990176|nr:DUF732 domain-containing protein [uncultured Corynebacterium sp.]
MRQASAVLTLAASALILAACGEATVDSSDVTASSSSAAPTESTASSASATTSASSAPGSPQASSASAATDGEQPAREISSVPDQASRYSPEEQKFLDEIRNKGVNVEGVEDQLTATGLSVCDGTTFTRDAVAGQLVEQRRTNLDPAATATLIDDTAHAHLC